MQESSQSLLRVEQRAMLIETWPELLHRINPSPQLWSSLVKHKVISEKERNDITVSNMSLYSYTDEPLGTTIDYVQ